MTSPNRRRTALSVRIADRVATWIISVAGLGTIVAVSTVCIFLVAVVIPLFTGSKVAPAGTYRPEGWQDRAPLHLAVDEYQVLGWALVPGGDLVTFRADSGRLLERRRLLDGPQPTAHAFTLRADHAAFGFADGTIRLARFQVVTTFVDPDALPAELRALAAGTLADHDKGVLQRTPEGQFRHQTIQVELDEPVRLTSKAEVVLIDQTVRPTGPVICALTADGRLQIKSVVKKKNLLTGKVTTTLAGGETSVETRTERPSHLLVSGIADTVYVVWADGHLVRFDIRDIERPVLAETLDVVPEPDRRLTVAKFLIGKTSLAFGDSAGETRVWFRTKPEGATTADATTLVRSTVFAGAGSPVTALAPSSRTRMLAAGYESGAVRLFHVTSGQLLAETNFEPAAAATALSITAKDDGLFGATSVGLTRWSVHAPHPETTAAAIFGKVWYEGYETPAHVWQSAGGTDDFEPKFGLVPLIFGTIKATVYSMIFGVPLALLAAVFTSEFLGPRARSRIKPTIEMMASLPSVVLGFLAALIFAPFIAAYIPQALTALVTVPFTFLAGGYAWQLLPTGTAMRLSRFRFPIICATVPVGFSLAILAGPGVERLFFAGHIMEWLDGQRGTGVGAWMMLLLPVSALGVALLLTQVVNPRIAVVASGRAWSRARVAQVDALKFAAAAGATLAVAVAASWLLTAVGWDPRGSYVDTYVQRNSLVVGFVMGFAIIPIIYTVSEDALSSVPEHLRAASLGAGATPWQTAVRVIIPTAMSGVFSAVMIGFGRAVGETMIVLMAAGNTPILEWNIFNGFRTLSANIAVELPEAVQGGSIYRMLFLAALTLFVMTFAVNTVAEVIRQRFRRRAYEL